MTDIFNKQRAAPTPKFLRSSCANQTQVTTSKVQLSLSSWLVLNSITTGSQQLILCCKRQTAQSRHHEREQLKSSCFMFYSLTEQYGSASHSTHLMLWRCPVLQPSAGQGWQGCGHPAPTACSVPPMCSGQLSAGPLPQSQVCCCGPQLCGSCPTRSEPALTCGSGSDISA